VNPSASSVAAWVRQHVKRDARVALAKAQALAQVRLKAEDHPTPPGPAGETFSLEELVALLKWWAEYGAGGLPK
jgi:hypothetical protein